MRDVQYSLQDTKIIMSCHNPGKIDKMINKILVNCVLSYIWQNEYVIAC